MNFSQWHQVQKAILRQYFSFWIHNDPIRKDKVVAVVWLTGWDLCCKAASQILTETAGKFEDGLEIYFVDKDSNF